MTSIAPAPDVQSAEVRPHYATREAVLSAVNVIHLRHVVYLNRNAEYVVRRQYSDYRNRRFRSVACSKVF